MFLAFKIFNYYQSCLLLLLLLIIYCPLVSVYSQQFLKTPGIGVTSQALTSTPVCTNLTRPLTPVKSSSPLEAVSKLDFRTPVINRTVHQLQPRTPTPFKNHLASLEKKSGVVKCEVRTQDIDYNTNTNNRQTTSSNHCISVTMTIDSTRTENFAKESKLVHKSISRAKLDARVVP